MLASAPHPLIITAFDLSSDLSPAGFFSSALDCVSNSSVDISSLYLPPQLTVLPGLPQGVTLSLLLTPV